jgi:hypothetical protein
VWDAVVSEKPHPKPYGSPVVGYVRSAVCGDPALDEAEGQIRAYCAEQGWNLAKVFREEGVSSIAVWRPEFQALIRGLESGEWVGVLLENADHLSHRNDLRRRLIRYIHDSPAWMLYISAQA